MIISKKKGPFISYNILKKLDNLDFGTNIKNVIKTWSRSSTIIPKMIGLTFSIYNGKKHIPVYITDLMVGHKLGEFSQTRNVGMHKKKEKLKQKKSNSKNSNSKTTISKNLNTKNKKIKKK